MKTHFFVVPTWGGCYWFLVGRGQECCPTSGVHWMFQALSSGEWILPRSSWIELHMSCLSRLQPDNVLLYHNRDCLPSPKPLPKRAEPGEPLSITDFMSTDWRVPEMVAGCSTSRLPELLSSLTPCEQNAVSRSPETLSASVGTKLGRVR